MSGAALHIRPFAAPDGAAVRRIASDTAQFGDPVEHILDDRRLFADIFVRPYLAHCADTCWVADSGTHTVGYLTGCLDTAAFEPVFRRTLGRAVLRAAIGRYRIGWRTLRAGVGYMRELVARLPSADVVIYPAHLHVNVEVAQRGQGQGRQLVGAFLDQCGAAGVSGVHLSTSDQNAVALRLYHTLGFEILYRYRSPYKSTVSRRPVETVIMGLRLAQARA